jgi:hypothetical protein
MANNSNGELTPRNALKNKMRSPREFHETKVARKKSNDGLNSSENSLTLKPIKLLKGYGSKRNTSNQELNFNDDSRKK